MARVTRINSHEDLEVYQLAFMLAMRVFELSKTFPREETYSLTDQIRRASRSVCANIAEGWRKRRYSAAFVSKLSDAETEATETQVWAQFAVACKYLSTDTGDEMRQGYHQVIGKLVKMMTHPEEWVLPSRER
jgi:four helix bundle protein